MDISINGAYIYFTIPIFGGINVTQTTLSLLIVTIILCVAGVLLGRNLKTHPGKLQVLVEKGVEMLRGLVTSSMGEHNACWTPYIGTIFLSSICGSLIGMTGFLRSTTADLSVVLTWAIMTTAIIWYNNIRHMGVLKWLKGFTEPVFIMTPMNLISEIAQPISMAFRHFGNVFGGSIITAIVYTALSLLSSLLLNLVSGTVIIPIVIVLLGVGIILYQKFKKKKQIGVFKGILLGIFIAFGACGILEATGLLSGIPILSLGIPALLSVYFDLFSGFVQAFVFSLLSMIYIGQACPPPETAVETK
ncbi:MAG: F0F1 ATP synthase subunit A [Oscillospiraceae bacterium]|nr:F0F1 ATP synthase subunit A [Oscillospiraceae bacterium]